MSCDRATSAIRSSGSIPITLQPAAASKTPTRPVPQPTSTAVPGAPLESQSMSSTGYEGLARSYRSANAPNPSARPGSRCSLTTRRRVYEWSPSEDANRNVFSATRHRPLDVPVGDEAGRRACYSIGYSIAAVSSGCSGPERKARRAVDTASPRLSIATPTRCRAATLSRPGPSGRSCSKQAKKGRAASATSRMRAGSPDLSAHAGAETRPSLTADFVSSSSRSPAIRRA